MNVKLVPFAAVVATLIVTGCVSPADDDAEGGAGALSAEDCTVKADGEKKKALEACQKANTFDVAACEKPSEQMLGQWRKDLDAAYASVAGKIDPITGACKQSLEALSCKDLLTQAGKDFAAAAGDQKACDGLRATRKAKCDSDASSALDDAIGADDRYNVLVRQQSMIETKYLAGIVSCRTQSAAASAAGATCGAQAELKRGSAYLACRRECPTVSGGACTPSSYQGADVRCGKTTTVSSGLGLFCESGTGCTRTALCDKYDAAKSDADRLNKSAGCTTTDGLPGALIATLTVDGKAPRDASAKPNGVTTACQALPNVTPAPPAPAGAGADAGPPDAAGPENVDDTQ